MWGSRDWTRVSTVFDSQAATRLEINCLFGGWGMSTGQAWHDDIALEQVENPLQPAEARIVIDPSVQPQPCSPMIFGGFLEHFGRQICGGVFDPGSPLSDKRGFRRDVIAALQELRIPVVRWPGGCFVRVADRALEGEYPATLLTGSSPDSYNDIEHPDRVAPRSTHLTFAKGVVSLPPHSLAIVKFTLP